MRKGDSGRCKGIDPIESPSEKFSISSVLPAKTDEMFGDASSDRPGFGEAGILRDEEERGGWVALICAEEGA